MIAYRPVRAKALKLLTIYKAFALTGRLVDCYYTQGDALGLELLPFQGVLAYVLESLHSEVFEGCGYAILFI